MKNNILYAIAALLVIIASLIKIMHWPGAEYANLLIQITIIAMTGYLIWQNHLLTKKLQNKQDVSNQ